MMRIHRFFIVAICIAAVAGTAFAEKALVRLEGLSREQIAEMVARGDDVACTGPGFVEVVLDTAQLQKLSQTKRPHKRVIPDLDKYVADILKSQKADAKYHSYEDVVATLQRYASENPKICRFEVVGKSCEGRDIVALKVSDNPEKDEREPSVLVMGLHHAREWISVEVPMATLKVLIEGYGKDEKLTRLVDERETWFVPVMNPDGLIYSMKGSQYWRKNRRKNANGSIGVDCNRNYSYKWGNVGASSNGSSDTYHGTGPFSEPENQAIRDLATRERFAATVSFHSYSELVLYPFGYGYNIPNPDKPIFEKFAGEMAKFNRYTPENSADLYPAMGDSDDYLYGEHKALAFTFELGRTFIPPVSEIAKINELNVPAVLHLIDKAGTYGLVTPAGEEAIASLDSESAVAALRDLSAVSLKHDVAARRLEKLSGELARRIQAERRQGACKTEKLLAKLKYLPVASAIANRVKVQSSFEAVHAPSR